MSKAWVGGSSRRWRKTRAAVLARDGHRCMVRLPGVWRLGGGAWVCCLGVASVVHHLHGRGACEGCRRDLPTHLAAACTACNARVGDPSVGRGLRVRSEVKRVTRW